MGENKKRILQWLVPLVLLICLTGGVSLYSQFLSDEEEEKKIEERKPEAPDNIALNIKAVSVPVAGSKCEIQITWDLSPKYLGEYVVARSDQMIDTAEKVRAARVVKTVDGTVKNMVVDPDCAPGSYYYVVLSKNSIIENKIELYQDSNYMSQPLVVGSAGPQYMVSNIKALQAGNQVKVTWDRAGRNALFYTVYRSRQVINNEARLRAAERVDTQVDISEYLDEGVTPNVSYFYAVTVKALNGRDNTTLIPDKNYTTIGTIAEGKKEEPAGEPIKLKSINARAQQAAVLVTWKFSGTAGDPNYRLFRSTRQVQKVSDISSGDIVGSVNINDGKYLDAMVPPGKYYYGLVPDTGRDISSYVLKPGVNITRYPVAVSLKEEKRKSTGPDDIDRILKRTFFRGKYTAAIQQLGELMAATDREEILAKARLFIGRSHIELGQYRKALDYLLLPDVKKYFPRDASFWVEFALVRLKNY